MNIEIRCFGAALLAALCLSSVSHAEEKSTTNAATTNATTTNATTTPRTLAEAAAQNAGNSAGRTDIVARVDSPRVTNILPWQEQPMSTPKNPLTISALDGSLTPTDRDRLIYETQYSRLLNQPTTIPLSNRP